MGRQNRRLLAWIAAAVLAGCSSSGGGGGGGATGGASTGGTTGAGGAVSGATGGLGSGGTTASGGVPGSGGSGGSLATGGGAGGAAGAAGGSGGRAGAAGGRAGGGAGGAGGLAGGGGRGAAAGGAGGAAGGSASTCPAATPLTGGKQICSNAKGNGSGNYSYELWTDGTGSGCMTVYTKDANFSATWTNAGDFLARIGLQFDQTKTPAQIGTLSSDFAETKTGNTGLVYVGIYGWTVSPLREYYIIDDWGSAKPADTASDGTPRTHVGVITVDGDTYDVWKHTQTNKPAITGNNQTFDQYFSVRQSARQCGHISISQHFSQWATLGLQLGNLEEAKLLVEAQDGTGTIAFTTATVVAK